MSGIAFDDGRFDVSKTRARIDRRQLFAHFAMELSAHNAEHFIPRQIFAFYIIWNMVSWEKEFMIDPQITGSITVAVTLPGA